MTVDKIMTSHVITVGPETYIKEVIYIIDKNKISGVPVVDGKDKIIGIISEKDLLQRLFPDYSEFISDVPKALTYGFTNEKRKELTRLKAKDIMKEKLILITPSTPIMRACAVMIINKIRRLPVISGEANKLVGIVSQSDVFQALLKHAIDGPKQ
ncbi:MAG: HPP family protein [bacterium]